LIYSKYILKVGLKNKLNLIPILIPIFIMIFLVVMNMQAASRTNYIALLRDDIEIMTGTFQSQKEILEEPDLTEQDELEISEANTVLEENIELIKQSIHLLAQLLFLGSRAVCT
jgi:hypothetical protein